MVLSSRYFFRSYRKPVTPLVEMRIPTAPPKLIEETKPPPLPLESTGGLGRLAFKGLGRHCRLRALWHDLEWSLMCQVFAAFSVPRESGSWSGSLFTRQHMLPRDTSSI